MGQGSSKMKITVMTGLPAKRNMDVDTSQIKSALCPVIELFLNPESF
jgi:hypothetical protein